MVQRFKAPAAVGHPGQRADMLLEGLRTVDKVEFFEDFLRAGYGADLALANESDPTGFLASVTADRAPWLVTLVDGGTDAAEVINIADDGLGGWLTLTTNDASADTINMQLNGEMFQLASAKPLYFEAKLLLQDVSETNFFIGLATATTDIIGTKPNDYVGFGLDNDGNIDYYCCQDATATTADTTKDLADGTIATESTTAVVLGFWWDGVDTVRFYVDGIEVAEVVDNDSTIYIPDDEAMSPIIAVETGNAAAETAQIDYVYCVQAR